MHEVRLNVPQGKGAEIAALALRVGIDEASVTSVYLHGPNRPADQVSIAVPTPKATVFLDAVFAHPEFNPETWSITSRELRAIFGRHRARELTYPMVEPTIDVFEDLWQLSYVTPSYIARAFSAAVLLAYGMLENNAVAIVVAALFLPFLSVMLSLSFGIWAQDRGLARQGLLAIVISMVCSVAAGAIVAALHGPPLQFHDFQTPLLAFGISAVIGVAAGLSTADDTGRRYLIGVAAAVQYAVFPVWFGIALVFGFPNRSIIGQRLLTLAINMVTIAAAAALAYRLLGMRRGEVHSFVKSHVWRGR
jgi:hypothetical protein